MDYNDSGVHTATHQAALAALRDTIRSSFGEEVIGDVGHFGGLYALPGDPTRALVATTDGLGTKVKFLASLGLHERVGRDLVHHCIDDIAVLGAKPLFFLDYVAGAALAPDTLEPLIRGFADTCVEQSIALIGGETAEMPGIYEEGTYDVAGFLVGLVEREKIVDGSAIRPGDAILGFPSAGLHTNGYSLATRALFDTECFRPDEIPAGMDATVGEMLAAPHLCYRTEIGAFHAAGATGFAHITGGGLIENLPRILPGECDAVVEKRSWPVPGIFDLIARAGDVEEKEMYRVFNMGIGLAAVIPPDRVGGAIERLGPEAAAPVRIGTVVEGSGAVRLVDRR